MKTQENNQIKPETQSCQTSVSGSAFVRGKRKLPKGKYKNVYAYEFLDGTIQYQSFIQKYKWSAYHNTEKEAGIAVDKMLISKGLKPINILKAL